MKRLGLLLFCTAACGLAVAPVAVGQTIAYIHGDVSAEGDIPSGDKKPFHQMLIDDEGKHGLSEFRRIVETLGYDIAQFHDQKTSLNKKFLADKDIIVFGLHQKKWSKTEKAALDQWLREGGGILIYSDSAAGGHYRKVGLKNPVGQTVVNNLISRYGMQVTVDLAGGTRAYRTPKDANHPILTGRPILEGEGVSPIAVDPKSDARVLIPLSPQFRVSGKDLKLDTRNVTIKNPKWAVLAESSVGKGSVIAMFDRQPMWNKGPGSDITRRDNKEILRRVVRHLAGNSKAAAPEARNKLAEMPHWPWGLNVPDTVPEKLRKGKGTPLLVWTPPKADRIRAVLFIVINSDSKHFGEHPKLRKVAAKHEMAIVYMRYRVHYELKKDGNHAITQHLLDAIAKETDIKEFRHAPWITFGKSASGRYPFRMGWLYPDRTIATINYHAETPTWPVPDWAKLDGQTILHVNVNGQNEWGQTWSRHVRPSLLNYQAKTAWLPHQVVAYRIGHGNYPDAHGSKGWGKPVTDGSASVQQVWDYLAVFVDKALQARLPEKQYPTDKPLKLKQIDPKNGYVIDPRAVETLLGIDNRPLRHDGKQFIVDPKGEAGDEAPQADKADKLIRPAAKVSAEQRNRMFWVVDEEQAKAWRKLHNVQNPK